MARFIPLAVALIGAVALTTANASPHSTSNTFDPSQYNTMVSAEQNVVGVAPEMLDWWWDNIQTTERFQQWEPNDHESFTLLVPPSDPNSLDYSVGTKQQTVEYIGGFQVTTDVTWMDPALAADVAEYDHWLLAKVDIEALTYLSIPSEGWLLYEYKANEDLDGSQVRTTVWLPEGVSASFPGYAQALENHFTSEMQNLPDFLPDLFQQEFMEGELETRGSYTITKNGFWLKTVVVDQEIKQLTPEMMDWWWDNINTSARYKQWNPTAHLSFEWVTPPEQPNEIAYSVGAVQRVSEYIGTYKSNLLITWLDPEGAADQVEYSHWMYAQTDLDGLSNIFPQTLVHEYQLNAAGDGIVMRSTFTIPSFFDWIMPKFSRELAQHALQEMQCLQYFLPELFQQEYLNQQP